MAVGVGLGWASTVFAERHAAAIAAIHIGAWSFAPDAGTSTLNPYLRARFAKTGEIPMPSAVGLTLTAAQDDAGRSLDRRCRYRVTGPMPRARFWTLEAASGDGFPIDNPTGRSGFTSQDVLREAGGAFAIVVSPIAEPGNWIPITGGGPLILVLRLYEPSFSVLGSDTVRTLPVPHIKVQSCG